MITLPIPTLWEAIKCAITGDYCEDYYNRVANHRIVINGSLYQVLDVKPGVFILDEINGRGYSSGKKLIELKIGCAL